MWYIQAITQYAFVPPFPEPLSSLVGTSSTSEVKREVTYVNESIDKEPRGCKDDKSSVWKCEGVGAR